MVSPSLHLQRTIGNQAAQQLLPLQAKRYGLDVVSNALAPSYFNHDFSRVPVHAEASVKIQSKVTVNALGKVYEEEADRVSEQVMRMPEPEFQRACTCNGNCGDYQKEQSGRENEPLRMKRVSEDGLGQIAVPPIVHEVLRSPGQPLDAPTRAFMEPRFGHSFNEVRIHTNTRAAESARKVDALAYTVGSNVVFGSGRYAPASSDGQRLLAHELAHVVQQSKCDDVGCSATGPILARKTAPLTPPTAPANSKTMFHPGVMHDHKPSGKWAEVQADPNSQIGLNTICRHSSPFVVILAATAAGLHGKPIALLHLQWFIGGGGADFDENSNLDLMLQTDSGVQKKIGTKIPAGQVSGAFTDHVAITQDDYDNEDFQFSFGEIDRLDFQADFSAGTLHAWFQDRYEWHPVYSFYPKFSGDYIRPTNCVHAAAVELKSGHARDYWMKGEATIPLKALQSPTLGSRVPTQTL